MKNKIERLAYGTGLFLFLLPLILFIVACLWLLIGQSINAFLLPVSILLTGLFWRFLLKEKKYNKVTFFGILCCSLILCVGLVVVSGYYFDFSFDGQWYHQDAVILLKNGWNPFFDYPISNALASGQNANYVNCYPKASWTVSACIYAATGAIETAKAVNFILLFASFFLSLHFLLRWFSLTLYTAVIFSVLLSFSPVVVGQTLSFYVDGQIAVFCLLSIFFICQWIENLDKKEPLWILGLCIIYFVNIKFTGLIYLVIFLVFSVAWVFWKTRKKVILMISKLSILMLVGVFIFGFSTYTRNSIQHGHPFYPIMGKNNEGKQISASQYPLNFFGLNRFHKFYLSSFALPNYTSPKTHPSVPKTLFTASVVKNSLPYYRNHQPVEMSPLGPMQAELLILLIPLICLSFFLYRKTWIYVVFFGLVCSCIIQPEFWNYRYAPQILFVYFLFILPALLHKNWWLKCYGHFILFGFLVSFILSHNQYYKWNAEKTCLLKTNFNALKNTKFQLKKGWVRSFEIKLQERNLVGTALAENSKDSLKNFSGDDVSGWLYTLKK